MAWVWHTHLIYILNNGFRPRYPVKHHRLSFHTHFGRTILQCHVWTFYGWILFFGLLDYAQPCALLIALHINWFQADASPHKTLSGRGHHWCGYDGHHPGVLWVIVCYIISVYHTYQIYIFTTCTFQHVSHQTYMVTITLTIYLRLQAPTVLNNELNYRIHTFHTLHIHGLCKNHTIGARTLQTLQ